MLDLFQKPAGLRPAGKYRIVENGRNVGSLTWHRDTRISTDIVDVWRRQQEYARQYREAHREQVRENDRRYRERNREALREKSRKARAGMTPEQKAAVRRRAAERRERIKNDPVQREAQLEFFRTRYQKNRERYIEAARAYKARKKMARNAMANSGANQDSTVRPG